MTQLEMYHRFREEIDDFAYPLIERMSNYVVLRKGEEEIGFIMVCENGYIDSMWVNPMYRRQGFGQKLVLDYIEQYGMPRTLHIVNTNKTAKKFWQSIFRMTWIERNDVDTLWEIIGLNESNT